jgi:hypothetical protein
MQPSWRCLHPLSDRQLRRPERCTATRQAVLIAKVVNEETLPFRWAAYPQEHKRWNNRDVELLRQVIGDLRFNLSERVHRGTPVKER